MGQIDFPVSPRIAEIPQVHDPATDSRCRARLVLLTFLLMFITAPVEPRLEQLDRHGPS
jgi:hypothetical protein